MRAIADALGGHCRTLRRTEVGPFSVDDADDRADPARRRGAALPAGGRGHADEADAIRSGRRRAAPDTRTIHDGELVAVGSVVMPAERCTLAGRARAQGPRGRARGLRRRPPGPPARDRGGGRVRADADRRHLRPAPAAGARLRGRAALHARAAARAARRAREWRTRSWSSSRCEIQRLEPEDFAAEYLERDRRAGGRRRRGLPVRAPAARRPRAAARARLRRADGPAGRGRLVLDDPPPRCTRARSGQAAALLGRPPEVEGIVVEGDARGGTLGFPTANVAAEPGLLVPRTGSTPALRPATARRSRSGRTRTTAATSSAVEAFLLGFAGDLYGTRLVVELWQRLRDEQVFESEQALSTRSRATSSATERGRARPPGRLDELGRPLPLRRGSAGGAGCAADEARRRRSSGGGAGQRRTASPRRSSSRERLLVDARLGVDASPARWTRGRSTAACGSRPSSRIADDAP